MQRTKLIYYILLALMMCTAHAVAQSDEDTDVRAIPLDEFIITAAKNDTEFERILIDELRLRYVKDLVLPARDVVLSVKHQYDFILNQDRTETENTVALSKLFPDTGTTVSAEYATRPSYGSETNTSQLGFTLSQAIGRNAFGKGTRLLDSITGLEIEVARHQIVEAYEDYLASIIVEYINWYEAFQKVDIARSSYNENVKLLDNIEERAKNKIALPVDVNKIKLQVYEKEENLISTIDSYEQQLTIINTILRYDGIQRLAPVNPDTFFSDQLEFGADFESFREQSRTYAILDLLEQGSSLQVEKDADDLLPSINLLFGYEKQGKNESLHEADSMMYMGLSMEWPFPQQVQRAEHETSKIVLERTRLSNTNVHFRLFRDIRNLYLNITQQRKLFAIAEKKQVLAKAVLDDETENYVYGKINLNDFIQSVNVYDNNRLRIVSLHAQIKRLQTERLRILDLLISRSRINERHDITIPNGEE